MPSNMTFTRKALEEQIVRMGPKTAVHLHPMHVKSKPLVRGGAVLLPRPPGTALGQSADLKSRPTYRSGDGEHTLLRQVAQDIRLGRVSKEKI